MKILPHLLFLFYSFSISQASLLITEVMSDSAGSGATNGDWFELTNIGSSAVNLDGYVWNDSSDILDDATLFPNIIINAGESIVIVDENAGNIPEWANAWGLSGASNVYGKEDFLPFGPSGDDFSGLGGSGDIINIWDTSESIVMSVTFGEATEGFSFQWGTNGNYLGLSSDGVNGSYTNSVGDVASPGSAVVPEPSTYALILGLASLIFILRNKK